MLVNTQENIFVALKGCSNIIGGEGIRFAE
jgi:hypothetical protein